MKKLTHDQTQLLSSPVRAEILVALVTLDRASILELADYMGRTPKSLYYHVRMMEKAGALRVVARRPSGARQESVYEPVSKKLRVLKSEPMASVAVESGLRLALREYSRLCERGKGQEATYVRIGIRLSKRNAKTLRKKLEQLAEWAVEHSDPNGERVVCTILTHPLN